MKRLSFFEFTRCAELVKLSLNHWFHFATKRGISYNIEYNLAFYQLRRKTICNIDATWYYKNCAAKVVRMKGLHMKVVRAKVVRPTVV